MLNEEKVKQMTRVAMYESRERYDLMLADGFRSKDYRAAHVLGGFVLGTFLYAIIYFAAIAMLFYRFVVTLHMSTVLLTCFAGLILYVSLMFFYRRRVGRNADRKYRRAHKKLEVLDQEERKLREIYRREDMKIPDESEEE